MAFRLITYCGHKTNDSKIQHLIKTPSNKSHVTPNHGGNTSLIGATPSMVTNIINFVD